MADVTIGKAARAAAVNVETIRFYERRGLIAQPPKGVGYRTYSPETIARLRFIRQAQEIGFSLREISELLTLRADPEADCADVRREAVRKLEDVDRKLAELQRIRAALETLIAACPGVGELGACTILDGLVETASTDVPRPLAKPRLGIMPDAHRTSLAMIVEGMRCGACAAKIRSVMSAQPGVRDVEISRKTREVRMVFDRRLTSEDRLVQAVERSGYRVAAGPA